MNGDPQSGLMRRKGIEARAACIIEFRNRPRLSNGANITYESNHFLRPVPPLWTPWLCSSPALRADLGCSAVENGGVEVYLESISFDLSGIMYQHLGPQILDLAGSS
jgi:hypothetical protein